MATENQSETGVNDPVLQEIKHSQEVLSKKIDSITDAVKQSISGFTSKIDTLDSQITQVKEQVSTFDPKLTALESRVQDLAKEKDSLIDKLDQLENQSRRNNIRIVNLPEDVEKPDPIQFFKTWIPTQLGQDHFPNPLVIEQVHRSSNFSLPSQNQPRNVIIRLFKYQDRDKILRTVANKYRETGQYVTYNGQPVKFFPDLTTTLVNRRKNYNEVKRDLRAKELQYSLLYPMTLRVTLPNGEKKFFKTPEEAASFLRDFSGEIES